MNRFNAYINNDFSGCRLLAYAYDHCRLREVRIYMVPGFMEEVGVTDGTDRWIAPVVADPFSVNIKRIMTDLQAGKHVPLPVRPARLGPIRARVQLKTSEPLEEVLPIRKRRVIQT